MAKVNVNKEATTKTAGGGKVSGNQRGKDPKVDGMAINVGVKMSSKDKNTKETSSTKPKDNNSVKVSSAKAGAKKPVTKTIIVKTENISDKSDVKQGVAGKVATSSKPKNSKVESGLVVREKQIDPELALMASRSAAAEHSRPNVVRMQHNGKSMSGMVSNRSGRRCVNTAYSINVQRDKVRAEINEKKEAEEAESRFSKLKSTLIGVGVALVVAVVGFAGIAIFGNNKKMCAVNFESNGGTKVAGAEIICGRTVKEPDSPTKEGFSFEGWILEGDPFDFSTSIYKNATLVAKWKANDGTEIVTVRFDSDGGTKVNDIEVAKGKTLTRPTAPTKVGYVFDDWYLGDKVYDFATPVNENITLKAKWERRQTTTNNPGNSNNTVKPNNRVTSLMAGDATVQAGKNVQIAVAVVPSSAEYQFSVSSSDSSVVECNVTGTNITCVGKKPGTATVTIRDSLSGNRDDFTVAVAEHEHIYEDGKCTICGAIDPEHEHKYGTDGKCTICGQEHNHDFGDNNKTCSGCGIANPNYKEPDPEPEQPEPEEKHPNDGSPHTWGDDGKCTQCGAEKPTENPPTEETGEN